jgi:DNA (cytosine-5)-methyltransferase 1
LPSGDVVKPDLRDMERMQGFDVDWTKPAEAVAKRGARYKLVGNAVTVDVVEWIGRRLLATKAYRPVADAPLRRGEPWPTAAYNVGAGRHRTTLSLWPVRRRARSLEGFLRFPPEPLSAKATAGFLSRARSGCLRFPPGFLEAVENHLRRMEAAVAA